MCTRNLGSHSFDNPIYDWTNPCDILIDTINSVEGLVGAHFTDQDYDNLTDEEYNNLRQDQQFIAHKYGKSLEQLTLELAPNIVIEEEEDGFHQFVDQYNQ